MPAGHQQPPGEVDVLRGHAGVVAADGEDGLATEHPEHPRDDADAARQRLRAADQADDRRRLQHLHRADQPRPIGDVRRARDRRHQRGLVHPRGESAQGVGHHVGVGVGDDDELVAGTGEPGVELLGLAAVDGIAQDLAARVPAGCGSRRRRRAIGRAIVEHEHLELGVVGVERRPDAHGDHLLLVVGGDQHGHARPAAVRDMRLAALVEQPEQHAAGDPHRRRDNRVERDEGEKQLSRELHTGAPRAAGPAGRRSGWARRAESSRARSASPSSTALNLCTTHGDDHEPHHPQERAEHDRCSQPRPGGRLHRPKAVIHLRGVLAHDQLLIMTESSARA